LKNQHLQLYTGNLLLDLFSSDLLSAAVLLSAPASDAASEEICIAAREAPDTNSQGLNSDGLWRY
jgi:hypothetical protein